MTTDEGNERSKSNKKEKQKVVSEAKGSSSGIINVQLSPAGRSPFQGQREEQNEPIFLRIAYDQLAEINVSDDDQCCSGPF